jgi:hypothetical protein
VRGFLTHDIPVLLFEHFIETVLSSTCASVSRVRESTLEGVSDEGGSPSSEVASQSFGAEDLGESLHVALIQSGIDLTTTFHLQLVRYCNTPYQVKGRNSHMCKATGGDTSKGTHRVVFGRIQLNCAEGSCGGRYRQHLLPHVAQPFPTVLTATWRALKSIQLLIFGGAGGSGAVRSLRVINHTGHRKAISCRKP